MAAARRLMVVLLLAACPGDDPPPAESTSTGSDESTSSSTGEPASTSSSGTTADASGSEVASGGGCMTRDDCPGGEFCDFPDDSCGVSGMMGTCALAMGGCTDDDRPVCTCGDTLYPNVCDASAAGADVAFLGECEEQTGAFRCGFSFCISGEEYCLAQAGAMPSAECVAYPPVCDPPDCSCVTNCCDCDNATCCSEFCINDGGDLTYTCP